MNSLWGLVVGSSSKDSGQEGEKLAVNDFVDMKEDKELLPVAEEKKPQKIEEEVAKPPLDEKPGYLSSLWSYVGSSSPLPPSLPSAPSGSSSSEVSNSGTVSEKEESEVLEGNFVEIVEKEELSQWEESMKASDGDDYETLTETRPLLDAIPQEPQSSWFSPISQVFPF